MITVKISEAEKRKMEQLTKEAAKTARAGVITALERSTIKGDRIATKLLLKDSDYTGNTRKRMRRYVDRNKLEGVVENNNETYGAVVEYGVPPQYVFPPFGKGSELAKWAKKKLGVSDKEAGSVSFLIARKIWERGRAPKPFMRPAMKATFREYKEQLRRVLGKMTR